MPRGTPLPEGDWQKRHSVISWIALAHVPVLFAYALVADLGLAHTLAEIVPVAAAAVAGRRATTRWVQEVLTTSALVVSSAVLIHLSGGYIELHFHFFVVVALVTLYQQWRPFLLAIGFVALHHGILGAVEPTTVYNHPSALANPWGWAIVHAGFIAMASAVGLANWKLNELARQRAEDYFRRLYEGEHAVVQRLREADRVKSELVAAVSHEFRTPLTTILGLATTLQSHGEVHPDDIHDFAGRIHRQGRRLQHLVENILEVERPLDATGGVCDAAAVADTSATLAAEAHPGQEVVSVEVTPGLELPLSTTAARLVLVNLLSNALKFSTDGAGVALRIHPSDGGGVLIEVSNEGPEIPEHVRRRIFEPFVQGDASSTRSADGVGLGLHLVRRVVSSSGGRIEVTSSGGLTTFRIWLGQDTTDVDTSDAARPAQARPADLAAPASG